MKKLHAATPKHDLNKAQEEAIDREILDQVYVYLMTLRNKKDPWDPDLVARFKKFYPLLHWRVFDPTQEFVEGRHELDF